MVEEATIEQQSIDTSNEIDTTQEPSVSGDTSTVQTQEPIEQTQEAETENNEKKPKYETLEAALEAYSNLEKKLGEQSAELGELRKTKELADKLQQEQLEFVRSYGFNNVDEFKRHQTEVQSVAEIARFEADRYAQYLEHCNYPDEVRDLLVKYRKNPTKDLMNIIEAEFPLDVVKQVSADVAILKGHLQAQRVQQQEQEVYNSAKAYLDENVNKYAEEFKNPAFVKLFGEAFKAYGCELDTDFFVSMMKDYAKSVIKAAGVKNSIALENKAITDEITGLTTTGESQPKTQEKNILEMSEAEIRKELRKYK